MKRIESMVLLALLVPILGACTKTTLTAKQSVVPVLLGPVTSVGSPVEIPAGDRLGDFHSDSDALKAVSSSTTTSGNTTTTTTSSSFDATATTVMDFDVMIATNDSVDRQVEVTAVRCGGYNFFALVGYVARSRCSVDGRASLLRKPGVRPPLPPTSPPAAPSASPEPPPAEPLATDAQPAESPTSTDEVPPAAGDQLPPAEAAPP